jgi:hypothetical protein
MRKLKPEWHIAGSVAYYGYSTSSSFWLEIAKHSLEILRAMLTEQNVPSHQNGLGWECLAVGGGSSKTN